jgi:hypothetical protein
MKSLSILLTVLFIGLKLTNHIDWSWAWVLSPLWIWLSTAIVFLSMLGVINIIKK